MDQVFARNLGALTGEDCALLGKKRVLLAGCGGLGGYLLEYLLRLGLGTVVAADGEVFEPTNLNRQILCTAAMLGKSKAGAAAERAAELGLPGRVIPFPRRLNVENLPELLRGCDAALDALDTAADRKMLKAACDGAGVALIHGAVHGWVAQAALSLPGDGLLETLYPGAGEPPWDKSVLPFTPALGAALQASLCLRYLCGRPVEPGRLYCFDLLQTELREIRLT